ncbi:hypothetical protein os1_44690 [Comamonadaceae bacterium OS-1]|nr:hypothetical protein os1_44690 [Comamonadaceae bacterium OS-1]
MDHSTGGLDTTQWLAWFLAGLLRAVQGADGLRAGVLEKAQFWQRWAGTPMNARQTRVLNYVLDGMDGKLTNARWPRWANARQIRRCGISTIWWRGGCCGGWRGGRSVGYGLSK